MPQSEHQFEGPVNHRRCVHCGCAPIEMSKPCRIVGQLDLPDLDQVRRVARVMQTIAVLDLHAGED